MTKTLHRCAAPGCPGRPHKASELGHPPDCGKKEIAEIARRLDPRLIEQLHDWPDNAMMCPYDLIWTKCVKDHADENGVVYYRITPLGRAVARFSQET